MADYKLVSSDSHVNEPPDLWVQRLDKKYRDRAPHLINGYEGRPGQFWVVEGHMPAAVSQGLGAGLKPEELPEFFGEGGGYDRARPGGWDPAERLKDMEEDGVEADVIYCSLSFRIFWLQDAALQRACFEVYNNWLAEYCSYAPRILAGQALISLYDIDLAVKDLRRCAKLGLKGAMIWASPPEDRFYNSPTYDPFWAEAQELNMPITLHSVTGMGPESQRPMGDRYVRSIALHHEVQRSIVTLIFSGVMERFPRLKFVSGENEAGWIPFFLMRLDQIQEEYRYLYPTSLTMKASEYFQRQMYATIIDDPVAVGARHQIGVDNIMWSSDYPHTVSSWPNSWQVVERDFQGVSEDERRKMLRDNVISLYGMDLG